MNRQDFQENGKRYRIEWEGQPGVGSVPGAFSSLIERTCGEGTEADKLAKAKAWCLATGVTRFDVTRKSDGYGFVFHLDVDAEGRTFDVGSTVIVCEPSGRCLEATVLEPLANDVGRPYWPRVVNVFGGEPYSVNPEFVLTREEWIGTLRAGDKVSSFIDDARRTCTVVAAAAIPPDGRERVLPITWDGYTGISRCVWETKWNEWVRPVRATVTKAPALQCRSCSTPITKFNDGGGLRCLACEIPGPGVFMPTKMASGETALGYLDRIAKSPVLAALTGKATMADPMHSHGLAVLPPVNPSAFVRGRLVVIDAGGNVLVDGKRFVEADHRTTVSLRHHESIANAYRATIAELTERLRLATQPAPSRERGAGLLMVAEMKGIGR